MLVSALFAPHPHRVSWQAAHVSLVDHYACTHIVPGMRARKHDHQTHTRSPALQDATHTPHNEAVNAPVVHCEELTSLAKMDGSATGSQRQFVLWWRFTFRIAQ
jgi:hypothetical protein